MKRSRLPLTALRAFEAAGRHESFKRAAEELSVSEAAISRQVRDLEKTIRAPLFHRDHRAVHLTDPGRDLLTKVTKGFDSIDAALGSVTGAEHRRVFVTADPIFASLFLVPQLGDFSALHADIDVEIEATGAVADLREPDGPTLALRHSRTRTSWPHVEARQLLGDRLTPMVSPELARGLRRPADVLNLKLLKDETETAWMNWLVAARLDAAPNWGPTFSSAASAIQGAEFGQGAVLGNPVLCEHLLASGRLVAPYALTIENGAYWIVARSFDRLSAAEELFCEWLERLVKGTELAEVSK